MIVSITDYGKTDDSNFVEYSVSDLTSNQMEFLNDNLDEETEIDGNLKDLIFIKIEGENQLTT